MHVASHESREDVISVPQAVRFPVEMAPPPGFDPERLETWPDVPGRLEWVNGRLLFMPPCGDLQGDTVADLVICVGLWVRDHPEFCLGTNEIGMRLGDDTRGADAAIWRRADLGEYHGGIRRVPPVLAVEVEGRDGHERELREKAQWYLDAGVAVVWLIFPARREISVLTKHLERRAARGDILPADPALPGLAPRADEFFRQISLQQA